MLADALLGGGDRVVGLFETEARIGLGPGGEVWRAEPGRRDVRVEAVGGATDLPLVEFDVSSHHHNAGLVAEGALGELVGDLEPIAPAVVTAHAEDGSGAGDRGCERPEWRGGRRAPPPPPRGGAGR